MLLLFSIWCSKNYSNIAAVSVEYFNRRWTRVQINIVAWWWTDISCVAINNVWRGPERAGQKSNWSKSLGKWTAPGWSLCSHLRTNFKLIPVSPSYSLSTQTPLANFHSPTLPDTVYHQSSSLRWLTCFERLELLVSTLYLQFRRRRGKKKLLLFISLVGTQKRTEWSAAFPTVLHLTSHTRPNGPPSWEHWGLMKNKFMDVEQLRHTDDEEFIPSPAGVCCYFIPELLPPGAVRGTVMIKRASLRVRQRQSAHVSNCITQTTCIPWLLLVFLRLAASLSWPTRSLTFNAHSEDNGWKTSGSAGKLTSFFFFLPGLWSTHPLDSQSLREITILAPLGAPWVQNVDSGAEAQNTRLYTFNCWKTQST